MLPHYREAVRIFRAIIRVDDADRIMQYVDNVEETLRLQEQQQL